jgi:hypothetical protein
MRLRPGTMRWKYAARYHYELSALCSFGTWGLGFDLVRGWTTASPGSWRLRIVFGPWSWCWC